ncbi:MAG: hypothetical protein BGO95_03180 [Micrococcales bacterium 73-13]|nr:MAG: hypothetical protein BGO95_03180 [Micrococcales bacterium 73-13]
MTDCRAGTWLGDPLSLLLLGVLVLVVGAAVLVVVLARRRSGGDRSSAGAPLALVLLALVALGAVQLGGSASPASAAPAAIGLAPAGASCATPAAIGTDQDVTFVSGDVTFHASFRGPVDPSKPVPAVVIVVGTGGVDRDGDASTLATAAYEWLADVMSANGIASLRYDKLGTGETGLGPYADDPDAMLALGYEQLRVQPIRDALSFVAAQPGVDPDRILLLGHSEGGAASLVVATDPKDAPRLAGLLLVEPAYARILDVVAAQFGQQIDGAVAGGAMSADDAAALTAWMTDGIEQIRSGAPPYAQPGPVPIPDATDIAAVYQTTIASNIYGADPAQMVITHAYRTLYGKQFDEVVPAELSPLVTVPTLITCGSKDFNTPCGDGTPGSGVIAVAQGFGQGVARFVIIPDMVHILRDIGSADVFQPVDQVVYPFSLALESVIGDFVARFTAGQAE